MDNTGTDRLPSPGWYGFEEPPVVEPFHLPYRSYLGRGYLTEVGVRLDPTESGFPADDDPKIRAGFVLPRPRFRQCHGFAPAEQLAIQVLPREHILHLPPGCRPRLDGPLGPRYRGRLVRPMSDLPDPLDLTLDHSEDDFDVEPSAMTSVWPEKPSRRPSVPGRPGTPAWPRLPGLPAHGPSGELEASAMIAEGRQIISTGRNFAGSAFEGLRHCPVCNHPFVAQRVDAQTCSDACRKARSRWSRNETTVTAPENNLPRVSAAFEASAA